MFITILFIIALVGKQLRCLLVSEWLKQIMVHPYDGKLLSNEKEQNVNAHNYLDEFPGNDTE